MAWSGRARYFGETVQQLLSMEDPSLVYFVEGEEAARDMALVARPLDVAALLERRLFANVGSVILTSATMATAPGKDGLSYKAGRLGCPGAATLCLGTPFDFASNVEVVVPTDLPLPDEPDFDRAAGEAVLGAVRASGGGAFILFTSYRALEACHKAVFGPLTQAGLLVLRQGGSMDRRQLLSAFREDGNAVLLGADSFWEGVDVPGPALRLLVIVRLPFPVPTLPLHAARAEAIRHRGGSSFGGYFLPEAVIRFRQGFGRLVRTEEDGGRVVCLDRRILLRGYGRRFQDAVPQVPWLKDVAFGTDKS
jgi:ATP-dependent DNA helicase DinG